MYISKVHIQNYRALKDVIIEMSSFNCIIGENNTGKSSLMHAIQSFLDGKKLKESDYYNREEPVKIKTTLIIEDSDLDLIKDEEHRRRISELIRDGKLKFSQSFPLNDKVKMTCTKIIPKDNKWSDEEILKTIKGKKVAETKQSVIEKYPEITNEIKSIEGQISQSKVKDIINQFISNLPDDDLKEDDFCNLPTGIDASVKSLLPEPIFIPSVKDISEDIKTTDRAVFGKLLGLLLNDIQDEKEMQLFKNALVDLDKKLNIVKGDDGKPADNRFWQIQKLENTIEKNIKQNFHDVKVNIKIPPPDLKTVLQSSEIHINDGGVIGGVETKGDGLKRSVLFALFQAFVQLSKSDSWAGDIDTINHIILFEEPELYLHPNAQQILFDSLDEVSKSFQVVVTTHSPLFFSARKTKGFAKLIKYDSTGDVPYSDLIFVDLEKDLDIKDEFQILCFENNNVAFFANKVVLVEGDSDVVAYKHLAHTLNTDWDFDKGKTQMVKVCGKGNFDRFRKFFEKFEIQPFILADLDVLLSNFDKLGINSNSSLISERSQLIQEVNKYTSTPTFNKDDVKSTWKDDGNRILKIVSKMRNEEKPTEEDVDYLQYIEEKLGLNKARLDVLKNHDAIQEQKRTYLFKLRKEGIMVLERGCLEDYYPDSVTGKNKTMKSDSFRKTIFSREEALALASDVPDEDSTMKNEFEAIFSRIFE